MQLDKQADIEMNSSRMEIFKINSSFRLFFDAKNLFKLPLIL